MKLKYALYVIIAGLVAFGGRNAWAQSGKSEAEILEDIRSGRIQVTDELIEAQRLLHPELKGMSNQEIRAKLAEKVNQQPKSDATPDSPEPTRPPPENKKPPSPEAQRNSRFPSGLARFGMDFFTNNNSGVVGGTMPSLPEYVLSPGDEIQISTWGRESQTRSVVLDNEGMVHFPPLQPMRLAGMKFGDAQNSIIAEAEKIQGLKASVSMGRLRSIRVMILGEVNSPGSYVISAGATVTTALFQSGGISSIGSLRGIQLRRGGSVAATLDLYEMLLRGNSRGDVQLMAGDAVFVPVAPTQVAITGMVKRPAIYEVKPGTKVLDVLELAGGLSSNAFKGRVRLDRVEGYKRKIVLDISMEKVGKSANPPIIDGDVLFVDQVLDREFDVVYLKGNVNRPGRFEFKKGMTVKDLIPSRKELKSETFFNYGHIKRRAEDDERTILLPFSLGDVLDKGSVVPLQPRDTIVVYSRYELMDQSQVKVDGLVRKPGSYDFVEQMRLSDLIIAAGGLTVDAYLPEAHLLRRRRLETNDSLQSTLVKVNLSGLVENPADENNIELKPFDALIVFPRSNFIFPKKVTVYGAIKNSGDFELTENMSVRDVISQANGLTKNSYMLNVEVVRRKVKGDSLATREIFKVPLSDLQAGKNNFQLEDGDGIYVREVVNSKERSNVMVAGEFEFPGRYEFSTGEKMSSIIHRAGGFSQHAYLRGAVFIRKSVKVQQLTHLEELSQRLEHQMQIMLEQTVEEKEKMGIRAAIEQRKNILTEIRSAPGLGRIVVSLDRNFEFENSDWDISMENGDSLWIGPQPNTISIMGEVYSPTNVIFTKRNNTIGECLTVAGGVNEFGNYSNTYYISPDGSIETPNTTPWYMSYAWKGVEPGGSIIVPPKGPKKDYLDALSKITQIIYNTAVSVGIVKTLF